jgi:hypothetical protein
LKKRPKPSATFPCDRYDCHSQSNRGQP